MKDPIIDIHSGGDGVRDKIGEFEGGDDGVGIGIIQGSVHLGDFALELGVKGVKIDFRILNGEEVSGGGSRRRARRRIRKGKGGRGVSPGGRGRGGRSSDSDGPSLGHGACDGLGNSLGLGDRGRGDRSGDDTGLRDGRRGNLDGGSLRDSYRRVPTVRGMDEGDDDRQNRESKRVGTHWLREL